MDISKIRTKTGVCINLDNISRPVCEPLGFLLAVFLRYMVSKVAVLTGSTFGWRGSGRLALNSSPGHPIVLSFCGKALWRLYYVVLVCFWVSTVPVVAWWPQKSELQSGENTWKFGPLWWNKWLRQLCFCSKNCILYWNKTVLNNKH